MIGFDEIAGDAASRAHASTAQVDAHTSFPPSSAPSTIAGAAESS